MEVPCGDVGSCLLHITNELNRLCSSLTQMTPMERVRALTVTIEEARRFENDELRPLRSKFLQEAIDLDEAVDRACVVIERQLKLMKRG